ncbi:hypothetical protein HS125_15400 [bacterium]|nr:hypothetical protein [bacterium]
MKRLERRSALGRLLAGLAAGLTLGAWGQGNRAADSARPSLAEPPVVPQPSIAVQPARHSVRRHGR